MSETATNVAPVANAAAAAPQSAKGSTPPVSTGYASGFDVKRDAPAPAETKTEKLLPEAKPEWLSDRYKTAEDQAKAYPELLKKFMEKNGIPDKYDFSKTFDEHKVEIKDAGKLEAFQTQIKDLGFNQKQAEWAVAEAVKLRAEVAQQYEKQLADIKSQQAGPDLKAEKAKLSAEWGDKTDDNLAALSNWAKANLPPDVLNTLNKSAEGAKWAYGLMQSKAGPTPITNATTPQGRDLGSINGRIQELMAHKEYNRTSTVGREIQAKLLDLFRAKRVAEGKSPD